jgi:NADH-quinone oxidoreductase subunit L
MQGDPRFSQFFAYLNLFVFSMLMLVMGDNLLITFLGWEGVGACSYFLISFWFEKEENATAGKKAFVTNRIGDWGFLLGMFFTFFTFGSLEYAEFLPLAPGITATTATAIAALFFVGAIGKSAQLPLFVWLPDAMAGPTPVSALIHAATMVTAGIYLMVRINPLLGISYDELGAVVTVVGVATAVVAATIAIAQNDIKKVLAYSTVSQLGFMFAAVGVGAYVAAVFHVITHAFFKALLFLGSGSVIHGMADEQDMRRMGGLAKWMPVTSATFAIGVLAIAGIPPFGGFWSKDEIVVFSYDEAPIIALVLVAAAFLTAVYMTRQYVMVFKGSPRWGADRDAAPVALLEEGADTDEADSAELEHADTGHGAHHLAATDPDFHPHESGWLMLVPLVVLAVFSILGGVANLPFTESSKFLEHWLEPSVPFEHHLTVDTEVKIAIALASALVAIGGMVVGWIVYSKRAADRDAREPEFLGRAWYIDWAYAQLVAGPGTALFNAAAWFDRTVIDGAVNGVAAIARGSGGGLRHVQSGFVRSYALVVGIGAFVLVGYVLTRMTF